MREGQLLSLPVLDERIVNLIMKETNYYMDSFCIMMEDINMVILNLMIAIAYYRIITGHELTSPCEQICPGFESNTSRRRTFDSLS